MYSVYVYTRLPDYFMQLIELEITKNNQYSVAISLFLLAEFVTHHSNRKVVVDDLVGHRVSNCLRINWYHLEAPAVHRNHLASIYLLQDVFQIRPLISFDDRNSYITLCSEDSV